MRRERKDYLVPAEDDGLIAADIGPWAEEKYRRMGMYADMFATGMKNQFPTRVYLNLFSGSGHAVIRDAGKRVLTSPLLALTVADRFSRYVYCDADPSLLDALRQRVKRMAPDADAVFIAGDANARVAEIAAEIPNHSREHRVLNFCFVDPFGLDIHFDTIRALGDGRAMDFLILLALGVDANRNWALYLQPDNTRVAAFLGDPHWRDRWREAESGGTSPIRFLAEGYARAMTGLGYLTTSIEQMIEVHSRDRNLRLYYLAFFSKHQRGYHFWNEVQKYSTDQIALL